MTVATKAIAKKDRQRETENVTNESIRTMSILTKSFKRLFDANNKNKEEQRKREREKMES